MKLEINEQELQLLTDLVRNHVSDLHPEIRRSMEHEFKDHLKHNLDCFQNILQRLEQLAGQAE